MNELQSLILADQDWMLLTPTYHVFDLAAREAGHRL
jgi:hypothetical protein